MPSEHSGDELLTVSAAAKRLGISERAARRLIRQGELAAYQPTPRRTWVLRGDIEEFRERHRRRREGGPA